MDHYRSSKQGPANFLRSELWGGSENVKMPIQVMVDSCREEWEEQKIPGTFCVAAPHSNTKKSKRSLKLLICFRISQHSYLKVELWSTSVLLFGGLLQDSDKAFETQKKLIQKERSQTENQTGRNHCWFVRICDWIDDWASNFVMFWFFCIFLRCCHAKSFEGFTKLTRLCKDLP